MKPYTNGLATTLHVFRTIAAFSCGDMIPYGMVPVNTMVKYHWA